MRGLQIAETPLGDEWTTLSIAGEIDLATVDELTKAIKKVQAASNCGLLVDLTDTPFMDSTGLKTLVTAHREFTEAGRPFAVAVKPGPIDRLIELSGVASTLRIVSGSAEILADGAALD